MSYCWKCGEKLPDDGSCPVCGVMAESRRPLPANAPEEAKALRAIYDRYGCKQVLGQSALLYNAIGDFLGEDGRKLLTMHSKSEIAKIISGLLAIAIFGVLMSSLFS